MKKSSFKGWPVLIALVWLLLACACSPITGSGQSQVSLPITLTAGQNIGQTFTARQSGLIGIQLWLEPQTNGTGSIQLSLYNDPQKHNLLATANLPVGSVLKPGWQTINFDKISDLQAGDYFMQLGIEGQGGIVVGAGVGSSYLDGSFYENDQPAADKQLSFTPVFSLLSAAKGLLLEGLNWLLWAFLAGIVFILPGWGLMSAAWPGWNKFRWPERSGVAIGVSLAIYPVLLLWTNLVGWQLGAVYAFLPAGLAAAWLIWKNGIREKAAFLKRRPDIQIPDILLLIVMAVVLGCRFYVARLMPFPLWWDSIHHTTITQLLVNNGGLVNNWQPYADLTSLTYHFGFHSAMAVFHWISGLNVPQAVLWGGQILSALGALALYPLASRLGRSPWAGLAAVLAVGLLGPLTGFTINWATYTLLAGLTVLTAVLWMAWDVIEAGNRRLPALILTGVVTAGLALTHYRVFIYILLFYLLLLLLGLRKGEWLRRLGALAAIGLTGGILYLPWIIHLIPGKLMLSFSTKISTPVSEMSPFTLIYNTTIGPLTSFLSLGLWIALGLAIGWALWRRERLGLVIIFWCGAIAIAANPNWIGLPGAGVLKNFSVLVGLYLPAGIFVGAAGGWTADAVIARFGRWSRIPLALAILVLAIVGGRARLGELQLENYTVGTRPDVRAAEWVKTNLPEDASFLVNSVFTYGGSTIAGTDGGWWLTLLTGRKTTQPPIPYTSEQSSRPDFVAWTNGLTNLVLKNGVDSAAVLAELKARQIDYVYVGQRQGLAGNWTEPPLLNVQTLLASPSYHLIYHQDRVYIFQRVE
jgi:hypothetical protein